MSTFGLWQVLVGCGAHDKGWGVSSSGSTLGTSGSAAEPADADEPTEEPVDTAEPECDVIAPVVLFASPDDSNSMSSPVMVREAVLGGWGGVGMVRSWEFFNYATFDYPAAATGDVDIHLHLAEAEEPGTWELMVAMRSDDVAEGERAPMNLSFSIDTSGSMAGEPLRLVKDSLRVIASHLRPGDVVSMVRWSDDQAVLLDGHEIMTSNDPVFLDEIDALVSEGSTNLAKGLKEAYRLAEENHAADRINRVVLLSDGGANTGLTDEELIGDAAGGQDEDGIYMVGVGVGSASSYNDLLMDRVTDLGKGAAVFIPSADEAERVFGGRFMEVFGVAARNLSVRYELPGGMEVVRFSGEALSTEPLPPQHLGANDTVVMHQVLSHCAPESLTGEEEIEVAVTWQDAITFEPREAALRVAMSELLDGVTPQLAKGAAIFAYTEALRGRVQSADLEAVDAIAFDKLDTADALNPGDLDLAEARAVLEALL